MAVPQYHELLNPVLGALQTLGGSAAIAELNEAVLERRDGAPPIDLVDGEELLGKLKELRLGVRVEMIEDVSIDQEFFDAI